MYINLKVLVYNYRLCHNIGRSNKACFLRRWIGKFTVQWVSITIAKIYVAVTRRAATFHTALNNAKIPNAAAAAKIFCALWPSFDTNTHWNSMVQMKYFIVHLSCANLFFVLIMLSSISCRLVVRIKNNRKVLLKWIMFWIWYQILNVSYFV